MKKDQTDNEIYSALTPQNSKTRTKLDSTIGESYLGHSKDPSGLTVSKIIQSHSTMNLYDTKKVNANHNHNKAICFKVEKNRQIKTQSHSKQPSFD